MDRSQRRRQLAEDKAALAHGVDIRMRDGRQIAALMRVLHDMVRTSIASRSVSPLMQWLYANAGAATRMFAQAVKVDCRPGCAHCCQMWVDASPPELLHLAATLKGGARAAAIAAVDQALALSGGMSFEERAQFVSPCPMLRQDGQCSVYAARPMSCRAAASTDVKACARVYSFLAKEGVPLAMPYKLVGEGYQLALAGAMKRAGLTHAPIELNSGLRIALSEPGAERDWLAGEDVFTAARHPPPKDIFNDPAARQIYAAAFQGY